MLIELSSISCDIVPRKNVKVAIPRYIENNIINLEMKISPDKDAKISVDTQKKNLTFTISTFFGGQPRMKKRMRRKSLNCRLTKSQVTSFDRKYYTMNLKKDWQVMMLPVSKTGIPENIRVAVLVKRTNDNNIQMSLMLSNHEITLQSLNNTVSAFIKK